MLRRGIQRERLIRFSGRLSATAMISLHYPPETTNQPCLSLIDQKHGCLSLIYTKLGIQKQSIGAADISWVDRFTITTPLTARGFNNSQPYRHVFNPDVVEANDAYFSKLITHATYRVRLILVRSAFGRTSNMSNAAATGSVSFYPATRSAGS